MRAKLPCKNRRHGWERLCAALQADRWPPLKRPAWLVWSISLLACAMTAAALIGQLRGVSPWITLPGALAVLVIVMLATKPLCLEFPAERSTVGQLTGFVVGFIPRVFEPGGRSWSRADVAAAIREITIEQLGISRDQYREDAHFVQDLHAG